MASASYNEDLTCSICLNIFTDPVILLCGHSFCRGCITLSLESQHRCPQCRGTVSREGNYLLTNHILKSLAEKAKETEKQKSECRHDTEAAEWLCPEHDEKLKLFCVTDQELTCIICRDGEKHEGHKFKPIREAAASVRRELITFVQQVCSDIHAIESQADAQRKEITKTKEKSHQLMTQIRNQFEEMHQFLRKREDEIKNELKHKEKDEIEELSKSLSDIETALSESRELEGKVTSLLNITDTERFLTSWTEDNRTTPGHLFRPKAGQLQVVNSSLSMEPYESHLQFFMWKEMLQVITPREELLSLKSNSANITVSDGGRSLFCITNQNAPAFNTGSPFGGTSNFTFGTSFSQPNPPHMFDMFGARTSPGVFEDFSSSTGHVFSVNEFTSGQHYWEIEVGQRNYWELGVKDNFLKFDAQKYVTCSSNIITELRFGDRPRKIGIYLNCSSKTISFYDADKMTRIHTMSSKLMSMPVSAYFNVAADRNRLTVCWY